MEEELNKIFLGEPTNKYRMVIFRKMKGNNKTEYVCEYKYKDTPSGREEIKKRYCKSIKTGAIYTLEVMDIDEE